MKELVSLLGEGTHRVRKPKFANPNKGKKSVLGSLMLQKNSS